jgi:hypothetical protein
MFSVVSLIFSEMYLPSVIYNDIGCLFSVCDFKSLISMG